VAFIQGKVGTNDVNLGYYRNTTSLTSANIYGYSNTNLPTLSITYTLPAYCTPPNNTGQNCNIVWLSSVVVNGFPGFSNSTGCNAPYIDYHSTKFTKQYQGQTVIMNFGSTVHGLNYGVWIDFNDNATFEGTEKVLSLANGAQLMNITGSFTLPATAAIGTHRMRIRTEYFFYAVPNDPCTAVIYGETEDYGIHIEAPPVCTTPAPGNTLSTVSSVCADVPFTLSLQNVSPASGITYQWQSASNLAFTSNVNNLGTGLTQTASLTTSTYYRCAVSCSGNSSTVYSTPVLVTMANCYCTPTTAISGTIRISAVTATGVNSVSYSSTTNNVYSNLTATHVIDQGLGSTVSLSLISVNNPFTYSVWVDWNDDYSFSAAERMVFLTLSSYNQSASFTVPLSATPGNHRMRIAGDYSYVYSNLPCGPYYYGEAIDMTIHVLNCTTPNPGNTLSTSTLVCGGSTFGLSLQNSVPGLVTYQWESADDISFISNVQYLGTDSVQTATQYGNRYYRCAVSCATNSTTTYSTPVHVEVNNNNNGVCYCIPPPYNLVFSPCAAMYISEVVGIGQTTFTSSTTCSGTYSDFSSTTGFAQQQYDSAFINIQSVSYGMNFSVWIDFNDNLIFESGELVLTAHSASGGKFAVPGTAAPGIHRMRIRGDWDGLLPPSDPCSALYYGETEDYFFVVNPVACNGTTSGTTVLCTGSTSQLSNTTLGGSWQSSNTAVATINASGIVSALSAGNTTITYTASTPCGLLQVNTLVEVYAMPSATVYIPVSCGAGMAGCEINSYSHVLHIDGSSDTSFAFAPAFFGPSASTHLLQGDIVYYSNPDLGCSAYPSGTFAGKIALIDRGTCYFEEKTYNAELAGALGVIIVNNVPDPIFTMGVAGVFPVSIPAIMISQSDGAFLKSILGSNPTTAKNEPYSLLWSTGSSSNWLYNLAAGVYTVSVSNHSVCTSTQTANVVVHPLPQLSLTGSSICAGGSNGTVNLDIVNFPNQLMVTAPVSTSYTHSTALFGDSVKTHPLSGDIMYYSNPDEGCNPYPAGTFTGKIALIDRGTCLFELKAYHAQQAGATGVIIVNNVPGAPITMNGPLTYGITIPCIMVSDSDGYAIKTMLAQPATVSVHTFGYSIYWSNGPYNVWNQNNLTAGTYSAYVYDELGCYSTASINVEELQIPTPVVSVLGKSVLCGDSVQLYSNVAGSALHLNGMDQWAEVASSGVDFNLGSFSIEAWIKTTSANQGIVVQSNNDNIWEPGERAFFIDVYGVPAFVGWGNDYIYSNYTVNDGLWHHVAVTRDVLNGTGRIVIDGVDRTIYMGYVSNSSPDIGTLGIGRPNYGEALNFFTGSMDEVRIWNRALSMSEIQAGMWNLYPGIPPSGLVRRYHFDEGSGYYAQDDIGYNEAMTRNQPTWESSNAMGFNYLWSNAATGNTNMVYSPGTYQVLLTSPNGCTQWSDSVIVSPHPMLNTSGATLCPGDSVTLSIQSNAKDIRFASGVFDYSSQWSGTAWSIFQILGKPNTYPTYGDIGSAWASSNPDASREYVELGFEGARPVNFIDIYETYAPGSVDTVYVKNPISGMFDVVYAAPAVIAPPVARIMHITFPATTYPVSQIRIAMNSGLVPSWNEMDAVAIGYEPQYLWNTGATTSEIRVGASGNYSAQVVQPGPCSDSTNIAVVTVNPCSLQLLTKVFIQGYYSGSGTMTPVLYNQGMSFNLSVCDSIDVELHDASFPYSVLETQRVELHTDGIAYATFAAPPGSYYVAIHHRNAVYSWTAQPLNLNYNLYYYDFSSQASAVYGDNEVEVETGIYALYSGDLNQDENLDLLDGSILEFDQSNFAYGYMATDINGDGNVDLLDSPVVDANVNNFIFSIHP